MPIMPRAIASKLIVIASCLTLVGRTLAAQAATLVVVATDAALGTPLPFADVAIESLRRERLADERGIARFTGLPAGLVEVRVRRVGFVPLRKGITLGGADTLRVALQRLTFTLPPVVTRDTECSGRSAGDTSTFAIIEQMRINAERSRLLTRQFPFSSYVERILGQAGSQEPRIDTLTFSGTPTWRYAPGRLVVPSAEQRDGAAEQLLLPELTHVASDEFLESHCFRYTGRKALDGIDRLRIDFEPIRTLKQTDVSGYIWLDTLSYRLVAMTIELDRPIHAALGRTVRVDSRYVDILPGIPIAQQTCAMTTISPRSSPKRFTLEGQRLLRVSFLADAPSNVAPVTAGARCSP
jgi:hypothetical protein